MKQSADYEARKTKSQNITNLMSQIEKAADSAAALGATEKKAHIMLDDAEAAERADILFEAVGNLRAVFRTLSDVEESCQQEALELYKPPTFGWKFLRFITLGLVGDAA